MFTENVKSRKRGRPPGQSPQGAAARDRLYETAIRMISQRGYEATTLREIAKHAHVSVGLLYRYFPSKRAVIIALYDELSADYARQAQAMPAGKWRDRFIFALQTSLDVPRATSHGSPWSDSCPGRRSPRRRICPGSGVLAYPSATRVRGGGRRVDRCADAHAGAGHRTATLSGPPRRTPVVATRQELEATRDYGSRRPLPTSPPVCRDDTSSAACSTIRYLSG